MKINKHVVIIYNVFILSPFLSLPLLLIQLRKGIDKSVCFLISILMGFLSVKYIPHITNDKTRYIERNDLFSNYSFVDLFSYFNSTSRPDYIFDLLNYFFAQLNIDIRYLFFIVTFSTVYLFFSFVKKLINDSYSFTYTNTTLFIVFFSFSLAGLLSGMRFMLAGSFFIWFVYYLYFDRKYVRAIILMILALSTHFSYSLLVLATLLSFFSNSTRTVKFCLIMSLLFFILPKSLVVNLLNFLSLPLEYETKIGNYTELDVEFSNNAVILSYIRNIWFYCAVIYLLLYKPDKNDRLYILVSVFLIFINIMYPIPVIFNRYIGFYKIIFATYLIYVSMNRSIKKVYFYLFLILYSIGWLVDVLIFRINFSESYSVSDLWSIFSIFSEHGTPHKILY